MSTAPVIAGWHACNNNALTGKDRDIIRMTEAGAITFLTGMGQNFSVDDVKWCLSINPNCHFFLREYLDPRRIGDKSRRSTWDYSVLNQYFDECKRTIEKYRPIIPMGQMHFQIFNEPNMPTWAQWEGFGDTTDDMKRFNEWFVKGIHTLRPFAPTVKFGLTPLTPGNRDVWFSSNVSHVHYYLHGPEGAQYRPLTKVSAKSCLCREAIDISDEYYFHVYIHEDSYKIDNLAYGLRYMTYLQFLPQKPFWLLECGYPNATMWKGDERLLSWFKLLDLQGAEYRPNGVTFWILGAKKDWGNMFAPDGHIRPFVYDLKKYLNEREDVISTPQPAPTPPISTPEITICVQDRGYTAEEFRFYLSELRFSPPESESITDIEKIFIHHTVNPTPETWRGRDSILAMKRVYEQKGWTAGPHIFVAPDGIWIFTPVNKQGIGVKGHNEHAIHIEIVGNYEENKLEGIMFRNAIDTFTTICEWFQYDPLDLCFHRDYNNTKCPGKHIGNEFRYDVLHNMILHETAKRIGTEPIRINKSAALYKEAHMEYCGAPLTNEFELFNRYVIQGFAEGILSCLKGDWKYIMFTSW